MEGQKQGKSYLKLGDLVDFYGKNERFSENLVRFYFAFHIL
jgi:hypothetical protein